MIDKFLEFHCMIKGFLFPIMLTSSLSLFSEIMFEFLDV